MTILGSLTKGVEGVGNELEGMASTLGMIEQLDTLVTELVCAPRRAIYPSLRYLLRLFVRRRNGVTMNVSH